MSQGNVYNNSQYHYSIRKRRSDETLREDERDIELLTAAANGHTARVNYLLRLGADIDHCDERGLTALHHAAYSGWEDTVEALHAAGANSEAQASLWGTPLHLAAVKGRTNVVRLLLRYRAIVNSRSKMLGTPLHCACLAGDLECATALLHEGADAEMTASTCVMGQSQSSNTGWTLEKIDSSAGVTYDGIPAFLAIIARSPSLVQLLTTTASRANATARRWWLADPTLKVPHSNFEETITLLDLAAWQGSTEVCCNLISRGADVNGEGVSGHHSWTALIVASSKGHTDTCLALLARGAEAACRDNSTTALIQATKRAHFECLRALLENGIKVDAVPSDGFTALMEAASTGNEGCVRLLLEYNASTKLADKYGVTAVRHAVRRHHLGVMELLVQHDPSCLDYPKIGGGTLLHTAVGTFHHRDRRQETLNVVQYLVTHGVDPLEEDDDGLTPLARFIGKTPPARFIRENKGDGSEEGVALYNGSEEGVALYNYLRKVTDAAKRAKP